jgi:hypothetical protein
MNTTEPSVDHSQAPDPVEPPKLPTLLWYEQVWCGLPIFMVVSGGLIGGLFGGCAWALNRKIFRSSVSRPLAYLYTAGISLATTFVWLVLALTLASFIQRHIHH